MQLPTCLSPIPGGTRWPPPVDIRDLAIRLETEGVSDSVARADFGFEDTWEMAEAHFSKLSQHVLLPDGPEPPRQADRRNFLLDYFNGISFGLPLLFSCVAILLLRFSLWGGELPSDQASAIGLGIACSFIASGGFVQAMSRRGLWYIGTCQFRRCANWTWKCLIQAMAALLLFGLLGVAVTAYFNWFPSRLAWLAAAFYSSLTLLWLSMGILYMLEKNMLVAAAALMGIANVALLHRAFGLDLLLSQMISIVLAAGFGIAVAMLTLKRWSRDRPGEVVREPAGRTIYYLWPYFAYGCLYFLFLFGDRLLAWTARTEVSGQLFQFRGSYEAAQDVALFAFIFQVGWVHSATVRFFKRLKACQEELTT
ncbi:MAG: exopolysaccharide Pel transporter PelG, partial [Acidobacteriota bacterium]|nr:exopolysaccharide Pel transporter PelG [Acidobacteriota bacterium]